MAKTVKEILREAHGIKYQGDCISELLRKLSIEITEAYERELAEKDKEIDRYINNEAILNSNLMGFMDVAKRLKQQQLYKEDFEDIILCHNCDTLEEYCYNRDEKDNYHEYYRKVQFKNDDYSKYDKLPSKEKK